MKKIKIGLVLSIAAIFLVTSFSPFQKDNLHGYYAIEESIIINKSSEEVFNYLGNSHNAQYWSVYVDHITPLDSHLVKDGTLHSKRRCFKNENEQGIQWDEELVDVQPNLLREITIFNTKGFPLMTDSLYTRQIYEPLDDQKVRLTFGLYRNADVVKLADWFKIKFTGYTIANIFEKNLKNIKTLNEKK